MKCPTCHSLMEMEFEEIEVEYTTFDKGKKRLVNHFKPGRLYACMECGEEWQWTKGEKLRCRSGDASEKVLAREILRRETL